MSGYDCRNRCVFGRVVTRKMSWKILGNVIFVLTKCHDFYHRRKLQRCCESTPEVLWCRDEFNRREISAITWRRLHATARTRIRLLLASRSGVYRYKCVSVASIRNRRCPAVDCRQFQGTVSRNSCAAFIELRGSRDRRSGVWRRSICAGATGQLQKADVCVSDSAVRRAPSSRLLAERCTAAI